jgi:hypothetical protein
MEAMLSIPFNPDTYRHSWIRHAIERNSITLKEDTYYEA